MFCHGVNLICTTFFLFNLEKTLGVNEDDLIKLEAEVSECKEELDLLCDKTEEQKLEV